jgi:hypothetical protein
VRHQGGVRQVIEINIARPGAKLVLYIP